MTTTAHFAPNDGVDIHYLDSGGHSPLMPVFICPGLSETAAEYEELIAYLSPRRCVVLSFRGRGQSGTPQSGYDLEDHVSDIVSVVHASGLKQFHLYAYSRGVSYAMGYLQHYANHVQSVIVQDYPAQHKAMTEAWAEDYIHNYLIPYERMNHIRSEAVWGIQKESRQLLFGYNIEQAVLVLRGLQDGSLLSDEGVQHYSRMAKHITVEGFEHSAHDIRSAEQDKLFDVIRTFLNNHDEQ
ncbi:alpha/beta fold hydrolase [Paenibacillus sp. 1011MAR3C5]|uniref:alpha/beta fold hydrolase n=1 Tax=Paenibacillus sp. 1011MAR3C5 TaxID=1675787 RepID=UPI0016021DB4|nr:alpha/beta hydrolase [Paenibacillus sp. 1011MAR3C5]